MICIFCGKDIKGKPIPVIELKFRPYIGQPGIPGEDNLTSMESCQECYAKVLMNRAKSIAEYGRIEGMKDAN